MKRNTHLVTFGGMPVTLVGKLIKPGMAAKNFTAVKGDMKTVRLSDFPGKVRIISSAASIDTDVCAEQARRFNVEASKLEGVQVIAISCDLPFALRRFCAAEGIDNIVTVSDHRETEFGIKYGFLMEELRLLARGIVVIDKADTVQYVEIVKEVGEHPDYDKALAAARKLL